MIPVLLLSQHKHFYESARTARGGPAASRAAGDNRKRGRSPSRGRTEVPAAGGSGAGPSGLLPRTSKRARDGGPLFAPSGEEEEDAVAAADDDVIVIKDEPDDGDDSNLLLPPPPHPSENLGEVKLEDHDDDDDDDDGGFGGDVKPELKVTCELGRDARGLGRVDGSSLTSGCRFPSRTDQSYKIFGRTLVVM